MRLRGRGLTVTGKAVKYCTQMAGAPKFWLLQSKRLLRVLGRQRRQTSRKDCQPMVRVRVRVRTQYHIRCGAGCPLLTGLAVTMLDPYFILIYSTVKFKPLVTGVS